MPKSAENRRRVAEKRESLPNRRNSRNIEDFSFAVEVELPLASAWHHAIRVALASALKRKSSGIGIAEIRTPLEWQRHGRILASERRLEAMALGIRRSEAKTLPSDKVDEGHWHSAMANTLRENSKSSRGQLRTGVILETWWYAV